MARIALAAARQNITCFLAIGNVCSLCKRRWAASGRWCGASGAFSGTLAAAAAGNNRLYGRNTLRYRRKMTTSANCKRMHSFTHPCKSHECCNSRTPETRTRRPDPGWQNQDFYPRELPILVKCGVDFFQAVQASVVGPGTALRCFRPVFRCAKVRRPERPCAALQGSSGIDFASHRGAL